MPLSIAACRTVLPFSTVTCRPSIVSVTVSINVKNTTINRRVLTIARHGLHSDPLQREEADRVRGRPIPTQRFGPGGDRLSARRPRAPRRAAGARGGVGRAGDGGRRPG